MSDWREPFPLNSRVRFWRTEGEGRWTPARVVCHYGSRLLIIQEEGRPYYEHYLSDIDRLRIQKEEP